MSAPYFDNMKPTKGINQRLFNFANYIQSSENRAEKNRPKYELNVLRKMTNLLHMLGERTSSYKLNKEVLYQEFIQEINGTNTEEELRSLSKRVRAERSHPYPLLQEIVSFKQSERKEYSEALSMFGLQVKVKRGESLGKCQSPTIADIDSRGHNAHVPVSEETSRLGVTLRKGKGSKASNAYLNKQYIRLSRLLRQKNLSKYIDLIFFMLQRSISFKLAHLGQ